MSIFKLDPAFKDYIWGGTRLRDEYGKKCDYDKVAESWELSCHKDGPSVVADGEVADDKVIQGKGEGHDQPREDAGEDLRQLYLGEGPQRGAAQVHGSLWEGGVHLPQLGQHL